jgi:hypothetical protein
MTRPAPKPISGRYRFGVFSRVLAAIAGGYALTALISTALTLTLVATGVPRASSVLLASLLSFAVYTGIAVWVFSINRLAKVWSMQGAIGCTCLVMIYLLNRLQTA